MERNSFSIADFISLFRLGLLYPLILVILNHHIFITFLLMLIILFSDFLDGYVAKKLGYRSRWGSMIDAGSDAIIVVCTLATLCWVGSLSWTFFLVFIIRLIILIFVFNRFRKKQNLYKAKAIHSGKISHVCLLLFILYTVILPPDKSMQLIMIGILLISTFDYIMTYFQPKYNT